MSLAKVKYWLAAARDRGRWASTDPHLINGLVAVLGMLAVTGIVY